MKKILISLMFVLVVFCMISVVSCDGDELSLSETQYYENIAKTICEKEFECCKKGQSGDEYFNETDCVVYWKKELAKINTDLLPVDWNASNAGKCFEYWKKINYYGKQCDEQINMNVDLYDEDSIDACSNLLVGTLSIGATCSVSNSDVDSSINYNECKEGLFCHSEMKVCQELRKINDSCEEDFKCDSRNHLYCGPGKICIILPKENESCTNSNECYESGKKLYCNAGNCSKYSAVGESCKSNSCDPSLDLYCSEAGNEFTCKFRKEGGIQCLDDDECISQDCSDDVCTKGTNTLSGIICGENSTGDFEEIFCEKIFNCGETYDYRPYYGESEEACVDYLKNNEKCSNYNSSKADECARCYDGLSCAEFAADIEDEINLCPVCDEVCPD